MALFPLAVLQEAEIIDELAEVYSLWPGDRYVMRSPGVRRDFVLAPTGVTAGLLIHFEKDEMGETALAKAPRGAETGNSTADDDDGEFFRALCWGKPGAVAQEMPHLEGIVDERAFDPFFTFEGKTDERGAAESEELAAAQLQ